MTADESHRLTYVDPARTVPLGDAGLPGYSAAIALGPLGDETALLVRHDATSERFDPACEAAPHEQGGPLDARTAARVQLAPIRCAARTKTGRPCRAVVTAPGRHCAHHRKAPA